MTPPIAVVICTLDRPGPLADAIADVRVQLPEGGEIVVVDQSAVPSELPPGVVSIRAEPGLPAARNLGLDHTRAPVVLFLDDDVRLMDGCIAAHLRAYADPRVGGVVGRIEERVVRPNARGTTNRIGRGGRVRTNLEGHGRCRIETLKGCNMSFRRQAITAVGGFDPGFGGTAFLEDADASTRVARAGWELWFEPDAAVRHLSAPTGGVRADDPLGGELSRFHNTGRFLRLHRGMLAIPAVVATFGAIAVERAWTLGRVDAPWRLMRAMGRGWNGVHGNQAQA